MIPKILEFRHTDMEIGYRNRRPMQGPEFGLVEEFASQFPTLMSDQEMGLAVFFEPRLGTQYPDIVLAEFEPTRFLTWVPARGDVRTGDLKILHHLYRVGRSDCAMLSGSLGYTHRELRRMLGRLEAAGLVSLLEGHWEPILLERAFGIRRLLAVEAKVGKWRAAFLQAQANTWFASESYVLLPSREPPLAISRTDTLSEIGIFTLVDADVREVRSSPPRGLPTGYVTWLFNEWIGRRLHQCS